MNPPRRFRIVLTDPFDVELDVTDRIDLGDIGSYSDELEDDLTELVVGDIDLTLDDRDGVVEEYLENASPGDRYTVLIERETRLRRPKWLRLFYGVLDVPYSISYDRKEKTVEIQCFAWSKVLQDASAEGVKRTVSGVTGNTSAGAATVTSITDTSNLSPGDDITLTLSTTSETRRILSVDSASQVTCTENWTNSFTGATITLDTPYYRNKSPEFLAGAVFTEAGITDQDLEFEHNVGDTPFPTSMNQVGIDGGAIRSVTIDGGKITVTTDSSPRQEADNPRDGFSAGTASTAGQGDWTPYLLSEPGSIEEFAGATDDGTYAWDHTNGYRYSLVETVNSGATPTTLDLHRDGVFLVQVDQFLDTPGNGYNAYSFDYDAENDQVWVSVDRGGAFQDDLIRVDVGTPSSAAVGSFIDYGQVRYSRKLGRLAHVVGSTLYLRDPAGGEDVLESVTLPSYSQVFLWAFRAFDDFFAIPYKTEDLKFNVVVYNANTLEQVETFLIDSDGPFGGTTHFATVYTEPDTGREVYVGHIGSTWFCMARWFAGVIPYADFEGMSCAEALRDLSAVIGAFVRVDEYEIGYIRPRRFTEQPRSRPAASIGTPLEWITAPYGDLYATSAIVEGEDADGNDISVIVGDTGDSARRVDYSSEMVTTEGIAKAIGYSLVNFLKRQRAVDEITIVEPDEPIRALDLVEFDNRTMLVLSSDLDVEAEEQDLRLVEMSA